MFEVPESWAFLSDTNAAVSGGRRLVVYSDATNSDTNVFLLITPVRGDYTQLGSFGTLDAVQDTIVPRGPDIQSEVIASSSSAGRYNYEYTVQVPNQPKRHLRTIFTLMSDNIVTFNAQAREEDYTSDVATVLRDIAATFSTTKLSAA
ncbi:hypothetical protein CTAYLR_004796 [Chrysophaeum taylorii]|uniref:PsbP C-terminal domain-containing protein n=1 Tax=Chrysophaeum taylorii TaxID=2483200 RepID=A0AAD7UPC6_9STRA|nr:hypothetical protein CTAYLR_004796 [Chrysophaeum taylorii]